MRPHGGFPAAPGVTRSQKERQGRSSTSREPQKTQTANKLFFERPMRLSRPRPQTQVVFLPPDPVGVSRALIALCRDPPAVGLDSQSDDRGCLTYATECQAFPTDVNQERCVPRS